MCPADNNEAAADGKAVLIKRRRWRGHEKKKGRKMERIDLNGLWTMNPTDRKAEYPAKIPGSVLSALLDAEAIPNPYYRRNEYRARELFREDYCFRREFQVEEEILSHEEIDLVCMGLDTLAHVELNELAY